MSDADPVWRLVRGDELLAELVVTDADFPWLNARVRPAAGFAGVRPLFDDELRRLEDLDEEPEQWEAAYRSIREVVRLLAPDGRAVAEFLLHIEGENAWWRWSDEPFPEGKKSRNSLARICRDEERLLRSRAPWPCRSTSASVGAVRPLWSGR